jgi:hypothetical protein
VLQFSCVGGERESQRLSFLAFLVPPHLAVTAYLQSIRNLLEIHCRERGGDLSQETIGGGVAIGAENNQTDVETRNQPIRRLLVVRCRNLRGVGPYSRFSAPNHVASFK